MIEGDKDEFGVDCKNCISKLEGFFKRCRNDIIHIFNRNCNRVYNWYANRGYKNYTKGERGAKKVILTIINAILNAYVEFFRGTPMIVQAMVIYYGSDLAFGIDMDRTFAAIFIVSINTGAYMAEIVRGGIISIDKGQFEAAQAIGMNHIQTMINVVLPQVIRNILPATGNEFVINIKDTSVLNVIGVTELYFTTKSIAGNNFRYFESFFITCIVYFIMTFTVTRILRFIEKKLDGPENYNMTGNQMQVQKPEEALKKA